MIKIACHEGLYYELGKLFEGCHKTYYDNGQLREESNYVNGKLHGLSQQWHKNGDLYSYTNYMNGERNGLCEIWYNSINKVKVIHNFLNDRLHGLTSFAGKESYYYKGVLIEKHWFTNPESITTKEWLSINNAEHRRVLMDIFKEKNIKAPIELVKIDECDNCILYRSKEKDSLLRVYIRYAFVVCPSTKREYYIPVPPSVRKAKNAVPWTFNRLASNYAPIIET